jgi:ribonuclease J
MHLDAQAVHARAAGVPHVIVTGNGGMVRLAPAPPARVATVEAGRLYRDGTLIGDLDAVGVPERRRLAFSGHVAVSLVLSRRGEMVAPPEVALAGLPGVDGAGRSFDAGVLSAVNGAVESIPRPRRRDPELLRDAVRRSVRAMVAEAGARSRCAAS